MTLPNFLAVDTAKAALRQAEAQLAAECREWASANRVWGMRPEAIRLEIERRAIKEMAA